MSSEKGINQVATRFTAFAERWVPDAYIFALAATIIVLVAASATGSVSVLDVVGIWGKGFWGLLSFTMQMVLVVVTGYVVATTPPVYALIRRVAGWPQGPRSAVALVAFLAMLTSWLNWGLSLMWSAMLAKEVARRVPRADYRALCASAFLGLGSVWAQGLSGSAALQMATASALPASIRAIVAHEGVVPNGIVPLTSTIFLWQSFFTVAVEIVVVTILMFWVAPTGENARGLATVSTGPTEAAAYEGSDKTDAVAPRTPMERLEHSPVLSIAFTLLGGTYLVRYFANAEHALQAISLDTINLSLLVVGVALHGTPARLMKAVRDATPSVWGIILQFPLYAGIAAVISETHLSEKIAHFFVSLSSPTSFPALIALYSMVLGVFVPSGGGKWVIEAPYVMQAAHDHHVHLGWMVAVYDLGEALANLIQPFWMLPILGLFGLRARDVMGYTFLVWLVLLPIVLVLVTVLGQTLHYPL